MHIKTFVLLAYVFAYCINAYSLGSSCSSKYILNNTRLIYDTYADYKTAFNEVASCASLRSAYDTGCCYLKVQFKNKIAGERYTHRGCIEITGSQWENVKGLVSTIKSNISSSPIKTNTLKRTSTRANSPILDRIPNRKRKLSS